MNRSTAVLVALALALAPCTLRADDDAFVAQAREAVREALAACTADGGAFWGRSLCGPIVVVEPPTRRAFASESPQIVGFTPTGGGWVGTLPAEINVANTAFDWSGRRWTMVMTPLPGDPVDRRALLLHELTHRIQADLGFAAASAANAHLDGELGRVWLALEGRALAVALGADGTARESAVADALLFRARRWQIHPGSREEEIDLETGEGLPEATGALLAEPAAAANRARAGLARLEGEGLTRSFAYATGPAYGVLLESLAPGWRRRIGDRADFMALLRTGGRFPETPVGEIAARAETRSGGYGFAEVSGRERQRATRRTQEKAELVDALVDGPRLTVPLSAAQISFDPNRVTPFPPHGTIYRAARLSDAWGTLDAEILLVNGNWSQAAVSLPAAGTWELVPAEGWRVVQDGANQRLERGPAE